MKTLHLLRHAKSSWKNPELPDRERGLNKRGKRDAPRMGEALSQHIAPQSVAASPARRAQLTLEGLCEGWPELAVFEHTTHEDLYTFFADDLFEWLQDQDNSQPSVFIIGHNPALTDLANTLAGNQQLANLPTAGYLRLALRISQWRDIQGGCGRLELSLFPRHL